LHAEADKLDHEKAVKEKADGVSKVDE